jgi:1,4-dihydroxy-2-naphthoate octaprenyltransferase
MNEIKKWIMIARPHTLFAGLSPVCAGIICAAKSVEINWGIALLTLLGAISIQVLSNFINDYYDFVKGLDKKDRIGFKRALAEGEVELKEMKRAIFIDLLIAVSIGLYLVYYGGMIILIIGVFSILFAWLYTATKKSLSYMGIADIFCFVFFGPVAVMGTTILQTKSFNLEALYSGFVCGSISTCVLTVNNIRDRETDILQNKMSFVVRFGKRGGEMEYLFFILLASLFSFIIKPLGFVNLILLLGLFLFIKLLKTQGKEYNNMLKNTGLLNVAFVLFYFLDSFLGKIYTLLS